MLAGVAGNAFELPRHVDELAHLVFVPVLGLQVRALRERLVERHPHLERYQFRDPVHETVRMAEHAADITHHGLGRHRPVGDDLRHRVTTVLACHVVDHAVAVVHAEIDVEIRHRHAFRVEETLEQQVVREGVEIGDTERIGDERTRA